MSGALAADATATVQLAVRRQTGREHCLLVGRGTTAIYLALKAVETAVGAGEVVLPTIGCASIAQIVLYAGFRPIFADVEPESFTLDVEAFRRAVTSRTKCVMPIHLYGHAARMRQITEVAREKGVFVIEDAAQALGGMCDGRPIGAHGDFSILSFSGDKILNAGGGGALLTDNPDLAATAAKAATNLPPFRQTDADRLKELSHRNLYHALVDLLRATPDTRVASTFRSALPFYEDLYVQQYPGDPAISARVASGFASLRSAVEARVERGRRYAAALVGADVTIPPRWAESGVLWRFTLSVNEAALAIPVTSALRDQGIHASNHYWSLADLLDDDKNHPTTAHLCPRVLNLWVDESATPEYIDRSCDIILSTLR